MNKLIKLLPKAIRYPINRFKLSLPKDLPHELTYRVAASKEEYFVALEILQKCYLEKGYATGNSSNMRVTPYHLLPSTTVLLVLWENEIIGTISLIRDNPLGLPMEKAFDLSNLRKNGNVLCEFSALAIKKEFRGKAGQIFFPLLRYAWTICRNHFDIDYIVSAVNPSMHELYESIFLFETLPVCNRVGKYDFANSNPAVGQFINLNGSYDKYAKTYTTDKISKNFGHFMKQSSFINEQFPNQKYYSKIHTPMKIEWVHQLKHFLSEALDQDIVNKIANSFGYRSYRDMEENPEDHRFRTPVAFPIQNFSNAKIVNVSLNGIAVRSDQTFALNAPTLIDCEIGPNNKTTIVVKKVWDNNNGTVGMKLLDASPEWQRLLTELPDLVSLENSKAA